MTVDSAIAACKKNIEEYKLIADPAERERAIKAAEGMLKAFEAMKN